MTLFSDVSNEEDSYEYSDSVETAIESPLLKRDKRFLGLGEGDGAASTKKSAGGDKKEVIVGGKGGRMGVSGAKMGGAATPGDNKGKKKKEIEGMKGTTKKAEEEGFMVSLFVDFSQIVKQWIKFL